MFATKHNYENYTRHAEKEKNKNTQIIIKLNLNTLHHRRRVKRKKEAVSSSLAIILNTCPEITRHLSSHHRQHK